MTETTAEDGNVAAICCKCTAVYVYEAGTPVEALRALTAAGWTHDDRYDHVCPACKPESADGQS